MEFTSQQLRDLIFGESDILTLISDDINGHGRWTVNHDIIFQDNLTKKYYMADYYAPATEYQDGDSESYFGKDNIIDCQEVTPVEKRIVVFEKIS